MRRRTSLPRFLLAAAFAYLPVESALAVPPPSNPPTVGSYVLPKSSQLMVVDSPSNQPKVNGIALFDWPQKVRAVNGRWIQIADDGGYALAGQPVAERWVRKDDVVTLDVAPNTVVANYTAAITQATKSGKAPNGGSTTPEALARLFWLRGIYWETPIEQNGGDRPELAIRDFLDATVSDASFADAWLRLGRMRAKIERSSALDPGGWMPCFQQAFQLYLNASTASRGRAESAHAHVPARDTAMMIVTGPIFYSERCPPQFYLDLGLAFRQCFDAQPEPRAPPPDPCESGNVPMPLPPVQDSEPADPFENHNTPTPQEDTAAGTGAGLSSGAQAAAASKPPAAVTKTANKSDRSRLPVVNEGPDETIPPGKASPRVSTREFEIDQIAHACQTMSMGDFSIDSMSFYYALACFDWAVESNPLWYRPGSSAGDLYLFRYEKRVDIENLDATLAPINCLAPDDLLWALEAYANSIRLNDQFDESLRGRASVLRYLAIAPLEIPDRSMMPHDKALQDLFADCDSQKNRAPRAALLDQALESAKAVALLTADRDPASHTILAKIQLSLAYKSVEPKAIYSVAQAAETLRQAMEHQKSTLERNQLVDLQDQVELAQNWVRSDFAGDVDKQFRRVWKQAEALKGPVDDIWSEFDIETIRGYSELVIATAEARRAISEINEIEPLTTPAGSAPPTGGSSKKPAGGFAVAVGCGGATATASVGATPATSGKGNTAHNALSWADDQLPMRDELGNRYNRTRNWCKVFINFKKAASKCLTEPDPKHPLPTGLQNSLIEALNKFELCDSDCSAD